MNVLEKFILITRYLELLLHHSSNRIRIIKLGNYTEIGIEIFGMD